jgi:hypothetical protein
VVFLESEDPIDVLSSSTLRRVHMSDFSLFTFTFLATVANLALKKCQSVIC